MPNPVKITLRSIAGLILLALLSWPQPTAAPAATDNAAQIPPLSAPDTTLFFAGDIMLGRHVAEKIHAAGNIHLPFEKIHAEILSADIAFANLESPFSDQPTVKEDQFIFRAEPEHAPSLQRAGFDVLSMANNHILNQRNYGLEYTYRLLESLGIAPSGAGLAGASQPLAVIEKNDRLFGFLSYTYDANKNTPGLGNFNDLVALKNDILALKGHNADVVIVSMHAGAEYTRKPNAGQIEFARAAVDAGADLVIGHHPHWIQIIEQYREKWIFYSLGNFVFDQAWSQETMEGLAVKINFTENVVSRIELIPVIIDDYSTPRWATAEEKTAILGKINLTSPILMDKN